MDLSRLNNGQAPVLNTHDAYELENVIGVVERAWIDGTEGRATVRLSDREDIAAWCATSKTGIIKNISVGYNVRTYEIIAPPTAPTAGFAAVTALWTGARRTQLPSHPVRCRHRNLRRHQRRARFRNAQLSPRQATQPAASQQTPTVGATAETPT